MLMVSPIHKMKNLHDSTTSHHIVRNKNVLEDLFVLHVSQLKKMIKSSLFFQKMRRRKLYESCTNTFISENKNVFQKHFFVMMKSRTIM